jgi:hypothetical protein
MPRITNAAFNARNSYLTRMVKEGDRSQCWPWPYARNREGYGTLGNTRVTHTAMTLDGRPRPSSRMQARHTCDNPQCFNPAHLLWGSVKQNAEDRNGRNRQNKGEAVNTAKLTEDQVSEIRSLFQPRVWGVTSGNVTELATRFRVTRQTIHKIGRGKDWKHVQ